MTAFLGYEVEDLEIIRSGVLEITKMRLNVVNLTSRMAKKLFRGICYL